MSDHGFFKTRTNICAAYIKSSRILEVCTVAALRANMRCRHHDAYNLYNIIIASKLTKSM